IAATPTFELGYVLGVTYLKLNEESKAEALFKEMVAGFGDSPELHLYLARAYRSGAKYDKAIEEIKQAIAKNPKQPQAHYLLAMAYLGRDGDSGFPAAIPELKAELQLNPNDYRTHYMLANALVKHRDPAGAKDEFALAAKLDPNNPDPWMNLAQL